MPAGSLDAAGQVPAAPAHQRLPAGGAPIRCNPMAYAGFPSKGRFAAHALDAIELNMRGAGRAASLGDPGFAALQ